MEKCGIYSFMISVLLGLFIAAIAILFITLFLGYKIVIIDETNKTVNNIQSVVNETYLQSIKYGEKINEIYAILEDYTPCYNNQ